MKLGKLGEFGLIGMIREKVSDGCGVHRGIGDDAAEVELPAGHRLLTSTDLLIETVHFRFDWTDAEALGHKAIAVNLSDIAAMGGTPRYLYLGLACPVDVDLNRINDFLDGALAEANSYEVTLVGGDTCRSPGPWMISVTVEGSAPAGQSVGRAGAEPGDLLMVSGSLGDSALALQLLCDGRQPEAALLARHHRPTPRVELGRLLAEQQLAKAMIDLSDGLASDLAHILRASKVDALINPESLPLSEAFRRQLSVNPDLGHLPLHGGEDYELLFSVAPERAEAAMALGQHLGVCVTPIGVVKQGPGCTSVRTVDGEIRPLLARGYDHFCSER